MGLVAPLRTLYKQGKLGLLAIDEAEHCMKRPSECTACHWEFLGTFRIRRTAFSSGAATSGRAPFLGVSSRLRVADEF